jgi:hypothetical protein
LQNVNSKDLTRNIETLLRNANNNDSVDNETLGFRRSSFDSSSLSDLHIQTIQEKLMRGGFFDNEPRRQRYLNLGQQLNVNGTTQQAPSARVNAQANNIFVKKTVEQASGVESADTDALFDKLNQYINNQAGGNIESAALDSMDLDTIASENMVAKIEGMLKGNRQLGQNGGAKHDDDGEDSFSFNTETINEILRKRLNNAPTQAGGVIEKINSEVDSLNSENIESLKNIILEQLSKKEGEEMKGGSLSPTNEGIINLDSDPNLREIENAVKVKNGGNDLFDSISENDLKQLRDMILSKEQTGGSNQVYSATSSTPISYSKLGLVGGGDDEEEDEEEDDDTDTSLDNSEEDPEKKTEDDSDASLDDELTDDESEEEEEESEEDEGETSEMARNKREESSSSSSASNSSESSSELQSSDLRRLHRYMNSDAYVVASNSSESKDYKINVQDFYTTDSNTYKGNDSGSEYFKTMRNRDRSH